MKKWLTLTFLLFFGTFWSQNGAVNTDSIHHLFWKITRPDSKHVSYLFGTVHAINKDKFSIPKSVEKKIAKVDELYLELSDYAEQNKALELSMMRAGRMTDYLSKDQRDSVYMFCEKVLGMDSAQFENTFGKLKPVVFSQLEMSKNMANTTSVDRLLYEIALSKNVRVNGLETIQEQISYFDELSDELQVELIMQSVRNSGSSLAEWQKMEELYLDENLSGILGMMESDNPIANFTKSVLIDERNQKWINLLENRLLEKDLFLAVGAGHLPSAFGLLSLLINKGFTIEPVEIQIKK